jgi:type IV pilus assembly protein PilF
MLMNPAADGFRPGWPSMPRRQVNRRLHLSFAFICAFLVGGCQSTGVEDYTGVTTPTTPGNRLAVINTQLGVGYMQEGQLELAWQRLNKALDLDATYSPAHNAMALLYERLGETDKASYHYRRATELNPADSSAQNNYGQFLCRQGKAEEAEKRFLASVRNPLYPTPDVAYTNAGLCLYQSGNLEKAETYLRQALQINPRIAPALLRMSELSLETDRALVARGYLQRYLEVGKHTPRTLWLGVRIERQLGDRNAVASYSMSLKGNFPESPETSELLKWERDRIKNSR